MVLAGDITVADSLGRVMGWFREAAGDRPIVFVPGNHEYYGSSVGEVADVLASLRSVLVLDNGVAVVGGQRFVGTTLWFPHSGKRERLDGSLNDFSQIGGFRAWVGGRAQQSADFLSSEVGSGDIVVTHHLPHPESIHPQYADSPLNRYFLHDVGSLVEDRGAALWVHGHTHCSRDYQVGRTRVVCNPFGYLRYDENAEFDEHLTIEV